MWALVDQGLHRAIDQAPEVAARVPELEAAVERLSVTPAAAARAILEAVLGPVRPAGN